MSRHSWRLRWSLSDFVTTKKYCRPIYTRRLTIEWHRWRYGWHAVEELVEFESDPRVMLFAAWSDRALLAPVWAVPVVRWVREQLRIFAEGAWAWEPWERTVVENWGKTKMPWWVRRRLWG